MKTMTVTISKPNYYKREVINQETGVKSEIAMISFQVSGDAEAVAQYRQDQLADAPNSKTTDEGVPLIHFKSETAVKYGVSCELERAIIDGKPVWFKDSNADKLFKEMLNGASTVAKVEAAKDEIANLRALAEQAAANRKANIAMLLAKPRAEEAKGSSIDDLSVAP